MTDPAHIHSVEAIIFDMDGTLVDSEGLAADEIADFLRERGVTLPKVEHARYHGITWEHIAEVLAEAFPQLAGDTLADELQTRFHAAFVREAPPLIGGAHEAILTAAASFPLAIASSSNRVSVEHLVTRLHLRDVIGVRICAEDCQRSKPHPEAYLKAAARLGHEPERCLVFEDSVPGLTAARSAGAMTVAIAYGKSGDLLEEVRALAHLCVEDYSALPVGFFERIK